MNHNMDDIMQTIFQIADSYDSKIPHDILEKIIQIQLDYSNDPDTALKKMAEVIDQYVPDDGEI